MGNPFAATDEPLPLVVDLDDTLLATDTLHETLVQNFFKHPMQTAVACLSVFQGRAAFKARLVDIEPPDVSSMPVNNELRAYLEKESASGRDIHLATAADARIAEQVATRFSWISSVSGTSDGTNLKGATKAESLAERFPNGFVYAGDSSADISVWEKAASAIPVNVSSNTAAALEQRAKKIERRFDNGSGASGLKNWRKALRLHQWSKNVLLFVPLMLSHSYFNLDAVLSVLAGFFIVSVAASGTYIVNDLADLSADRRHPTKKERPFAAGRLPVLQGAIVAAMLILLSITAGFALSIPFGVTLLTYLATTFAYSFRLKRVVLLDVILLSALFTLRIFMGIALVGAGVSIWLIAFSCFFFYAMSLAKRHVELINRSAEGDAALIPGRGYRVGDWPVTLAHGVAATAGAIIIIVMYLSQEAFPSGLYSEPSWLWATPVLIAAWTQRIWLLAHRGELDDDPVSFALRDPISIIMGVALAVFFVAATVL
ncbi:MAG: UbiA family prenyltransferase [Pseudomonadota bacterium]